MSSNDLENDIKPEIPAKRVKLDETELDHAAKKLSNILHREIQNEIKLRKKDLDAIEENIYLTKQYLMRLKQGAVTDYYKQKNPKDCLQYPPHPAVKDTFLGKFPRGYCKNESLEETPKDQEGYFPEEEIKKEPLNVKEERGSGPGGITTTVECTKPPCYIPPKPLKIETVKPAEPRGYISKKHLRIVVGNVSKWLAPEELGGASHKWTVYTKAADPSIDISEYVAKVVFFLHPSYKPNDIISITDPPFKLTRRGWGEFPLKARFHFKNTLDVPVDVMHLLKLDHKHTGLETFGAETALSVWIHLPPKEETVIKDEVADESDSTKTKPGKTRDHYKANVITKEEIFFEKSDENAFLEEEEITKAEIDTLNNTLKSNDTSDYFQIDESNMTNLSFAADFLNSLSNHGYKSVNLPDFLDFNGTENVNDQNTDQPDLFPPEDNQTSLTSNLLDDFLDECNFVESEIIIDSDDNISKTEEVVSNSVLPSNIEESKNIDGDKMNYEECDKDGITLSNTVCSNSLLDNFSTISFNSHLPESECTNIETVSSSPSLEKEVKCGIFEEEKETLVKPVDIPPSPSTAISIHGITQLSFSQRMLTKTNKSPCLKKNIDSSKTNLLIHKSQENDSIVKNVLKGKVISIAKSTGTPLNVLCSKYQEKNEESNPKSPENCSAEKNLQKGKVISIAKGTENPTNILCSHVLEDTKGNNSVGLKNNPDKNVLKGKVISIGKSTERPLNIVYSKFPKRVLLKSLNVDLQAIFGTKKQEIKQASLKISHISEENSLKDICLVESQVSNKESLSNKAESMDFDNSVNQDKSHLNPLQSLCFSPSQNNIFSHKKLNLPENKPIIPSTSLSCGNNKKKKNFNTKEVKSTIITLQKENGEVILRKEAKFKELKDSTAIGNSTKEKSQGLKGAKAQVQATNPLKSTSLDRNEPSTSNFNKSPIFKLQTPLPKSNNLCSDMVVEGKRVLFLSRQCTKMHCKPLTQKIVLPSVSLLKKNIQEPQSASIKDKETEEDVNESALLKRCPTQNTEIAVSWLMKRFPLVDTRAQLTGFRIKHPYCAKSRDDFFNWPFPKQRAAELMRAKAVGKLLNMLPGIDKWSTLEVWDWARVRAFTPVKINPDLSILPTSSDVESFYNQPTEEIVDFIRRCNDLKEKEVVNIINTEESPKMSAGLLSCESPRKANYEFIFEPDKEKTPFEPELQGMRKFINKCQSNVGAITSPELLCPGILYPSAERVLISAFYSLAEDIIRRAHNASWVRHDDNSPSEININDVKSAILSRKEFDILMPLKTEKKERPPVTVLPNFS